MNRRSFLVVAAAFPFAPALAAPVAYTLDRDASEVGFSVAFGPDKITGDMPVARADMTLDFDRAAASRVAVTLAAAEARANFILATQALRGASVLDTETYPEIAFQSTTVTAQPGGARVDGAITIRDVTRPLRLDAQVFRQQGTDRGDRSRLTILLTGFVLRSAFGATGWNDLVGDRVDLRILARVSQSG